MLKSFRINNNKLEGSLPRSLGNCKDLNLLDVGDNNLNGTFPNWLGNLDQLQVLILRSNRFYGQVDSFDDTISLTHLRIIDLSHNNLSDYLPTLFFEHLHAIREGYGKKVEPEYLTEEIGKVTVIMLVVYLLQKKGWTQSFNHYYPLGPLLTFLVINSGEKFQKYLGPIPQGKQYDTFTNDSYMGNLDLCGLPLSKSCDTNEEPPAKFERDDNDGDELNWKFSILMGYGCGLVLGMSMAYIAFRTGKPWWLIRIVEQVRQRFAKRSSLMAMFPDVYWFVKTGFIGT
ncbi:hypothetical protein PVK06_041505 [Gossypium arboreum]|uniref:Receptor-like protein 12 n=1 Tax=Gossypium arboreum TaxID=29729 RepID=A0ABR0N8H5_GOSAR|nr:hypothetical protein PVK06_041505 [Gossypium arboreum]